MSVRVIGMGQRAAGDDGVGQVIIDALEAMPLPADTEIVRARDPSVLVELYAGAARVVVVDALLSCGTPETEPGTIHVLDAGKLGRGAAMGVSSHGIGVAQALELARALSAEVPDEVWFVAVSIAAPTRYSYGLSGPVARAVLPAARAVAGLIQGVEGEHA